MAMDYQLVHVNIAQMRAAPGDARVAGLVARIEEMNFLAESSPGFVWRLPASEGTPEALRIFAGYFTPFEPERILYNMSVWESVEDLRHYVYRTRHAEMVRDRRTWIAPSTHASLALWWIPRGERPTIDVSATRLRMVQRFGPSPLAFTLERTFPPPGAEVPSTPRRKAMPEERSALFRRGQEAFAGRTFPVGKGEAKVARLLLSSDAGCDATITAQSFQVHHGGLLKPTDYFPENIPGLLSQLLSWTGARLPVAEVRATLDPQEPSTTLPNWLTARRILWLRVEPEQIRIAVRTGVDRDAEALAAWPEPFPPFVPGRRTYRELAEPLPCPHCGMASDHYRELADRSLVCGDCFRTFSNRV
jgi:hypothetical protein